VKETNLEMKFDPIEEELENYATTDLENEEVHRKNEDDTAEMI